MVTCYAGSSAIGWYSDLKKFPALITDPHVYISSADRYASPIVGESVIGDFPNGSHGTAFKAVNNFMTNGNNVLFSYCLITRFESNVSLETTPVAFTRSLKENGLWGEKAGLYDSKGGFVAFGDGHVTWFDGDKPAKFLKWTGDGYTNNIQDALPRFGVAGHPGDGAYIGCGSFLSGLESERDGSRILINENYT
ncbi:MAG: hypothetical protein LBD60_04665 [Puniceicoccales bacterium]|jgi:hypothetical protein|nr:hypothetical protein [Puniceicoccales bacterium]